MKAVILAGGLGSRLAEETNLVPKPMVEIGGKPILWHIMKIYAAHGINEFIICLGYKGHVIKDYFANYYLRNSSLTVDLATNEITYHRPTAEPWRVTLVDTGVESMTGGRLRRIRHLLGDESFCMTYGDGVSDVNISECISFHREHGKLATVTAVRPSGRFGRLQIDGNIVTEFGEKVVQSDEWVNGGFFVLEPAALSFIESDATSWEMAPLCQITADQQLRAYRHEGFWHAMDTLRDRQVLETIWAEGRAPWKIWE